MATSHHMLLPFPKSWFLALAKGRRHRNRGVGLVADSITGAATAPALVAVTAAAAVAAAAICMPSSRLLPQAVPAAQVPGQELEG